jgi:hypothetical protein
MLNVIALFPPAETPPTENLEKTTAKRNPSHVLTQLQHQNSSRLECGEEADIEIPDLEIYAAR